MLDVKTPIKNLYRKDLSLNDEDLIDPNETDCLAQGEWVYLNSSNKAIRITGSAPTAQPVAFQVFTQPGDVGAQAIGKVSVLYIGSYEAETDMFYESASDLSAGTELTIDLNTVDGDTQNRGGLDTAASGNFVHAISLIDPDDNSDKLRYLKLASPYVKQ